MRTYPLVIGLTLFAVLPLAAGAATLHPGDKVAVTVFNHPELSLTTATVDALGQVSVPLAGVVGTQGETVSELASRIQGRLKPYVRDPAVDIQLLEQGNTIFVEGGPGGVLTYAPGETLLTALGQLSAAGAPPVAPAGTGNENVPQAGGLAVSQTVSTNLQYSGIDLHHVVIRRDSVDLPAVDARRLMARGDVGPSLRPDDTIKLSQKPVALTVQGEVVRPGPVYLDKDEPLQDALLQAGGPSGAGSTEKFELVRDGNRVPLNTSSAEYTAPAMPGDVVVVPHAVRVGVVGDVVKPGDVVLHGDGSLLSALYFAGGPTQYGDLRYVRLIHQGVETHYNLLNLTHGAPADNPQLNDGDTVFVPEGHRNIDIGQVFQGILGVANLARPY